MKLAVALAFAFALAAPAAHANGRGPLTNGIFFRPGDPHSLYVRSTFGLLISHDDGCTLYWVCEPDVGYAGADDPMIAIAADGTIFAGTHTNGVRISRDGGCSFTTVGAPLPPSSWVDALDIGPTGEGWTATANTGAADDVFASTDNGRTFQSRGLASGTVWYKSLKIAHSNAQRVYVAGYQL